MYYKGGNLLHMIRQLVDDDARWRGILRGLNTTFRHQTVTTAQIEDYMSRGSGIDLSKVFDEYLRTTMIPTLEYRIEGGQLSYRWTDVVPGFAMPVRVTLEGDGFDWIRPTGTWQTTDVAVSSGAFEVDPDFYVRAKSVSAHGNPEAR
jgi:aminopeptidase N